MGLAFCDQPFNRNLMARFLRRKSHIERTRWQVSYQCRSLWGMNAVKWIDKCILLSDTINHRLFIWPVVIPNEPLIGHFVIFFPKQIAGGSKLFTPRMSIVFRDLLRSFFFSFLFSALVKVPVAHVLLLNQENDSDRKIP